MTRRSKISSLKISDRTKIDSYIRENRHLILNDMVDELHSSGLLKISRSALGRYIKASGFMESLSTGSNMTTVVTIVDSATGTVTVIKSFATGSEILDFLKNNNLA